MCSFSFLFPQKFNLQKAEEEDCVDRQEEKNKLEELVLDPFFIYFFFFCSVEIFFSLVLFRLCSLSIALSLKGLDNGEGFFFSFPFFFPSPAFSFDVFGVQLEKSKHGIKLQ